MIGLTLAAMILLGEGGVSPVVPAVEQVCGNAASVRAARDAGAGVPQEFDAPYEDVKAATLETLKALKLSVNETGDDDMGFYIGFAKRLSAWSWGEVGLITVVRKEDGGATVIINSDNRLKTQITGTKEAKFGEMIFSGVEQRLPARP